MIRSLTVVHSMRALSARLLIIMATPPSCIFSSPAYNTVCPDVTLCLPAHVHLRSLIPNMSTLYPSISLATCAAAPPLYKFRTFQCPIIRVSLGVTMELVGRWASRRVWPIDVILPLLAPTPPPECF